MCWCFGFYCAATLRSKKSYRTRVVLAMADTADTPNVIVRPPIAWALAVLAARAQLAHAFTDRRRRDACRLARSASVCVCPGAARLGDRRHDPGRLERTHQSAD